MKKNALCKSIQIQVGEEPAFGAISSTENNEESIVYGPKALSVNELNVKAEVREVLQAEIVSDDAEAEFNETAELMVSESDFDVCLKHSTCFKKPTQIDLSNAQDPVFFMNNNLALTYIGLQPTDVFNEYSRIGLQMKGVCEGITPDIILNESDNEGLAEGVYKCLKRQTISAGIAAGITKVPHYVNRTELATTLRDDVIVNDIVAKLLRVHPTSIGGSFYYDLLAKEEWGPYDKNTPPTLFKGQPVVVRVGIYIESLSNFETSSMDYDMDLYMMMAWRDFRLMHNKSKPILIKDEDQIEDIWLPDPYFGNSKESDFHEVTFLNFLIRIFGGGEVFYETRCAFILLLSSLYLLQYKTKAKLQSGAVQVSARQTGMSAQNRQLCVVLIVNKRVKQNIPQTLIQCSNYASLGSRIAHSPLTKTLKCNCLSSLSMPWCPKSAMESVLEVVTFLCAEFNDRDTQETTLVSVPNSTSNATLAITSRRRTYQRL